MRVGAVVFGIGVLSVLAVLVPFLTGHEPPVALVLTSLLLPLGFGTALVGLLRSARARE